MSSNNTSSTRKNLCSDCWCLYYHCQSDLLSTHTTYTPGEFSDFDSLKEILTIHEQWETNDKTYFPPLYKMNGKLRRTLLKQRKMEIKVLKSKIKYYVRKEPLF